MTVNFDIGYNYIMQQYFIKKDFRSGERILLDDEVLHHIRHVLRKNDGYFFRLVNRNHEIYMAKLEHEYALIEDRIESDSELPIEITAIVALIRNENFDLVLQKLTEIGVTRIVPLVTKRTVVKIKDEQKKIARWQKIVMEASEQSHRSIIPEVESPIDICDINLYSSKYNYLAYERSDAVYLPYLSVDESLTYIIGPEGGFEADEVKMITDQGFACISLGKRILRAETAAIFVAANIAGAFER